MSSKCIYKILLMYAKDLWRKNETEMFSCRILSFYIIKFD